MAALALVAACGTGELASAPLSLSARDASIFADAAALAFFFYADPGKPGGCAALEPQRPRPPSVVGPFLAQLSTAARRDGLVFRLDQLPVGTYVIIADAVTSTGTAFASACAEGITIAPRAVTPIELRLARTR